MLQTRKLRGTKCMSNPEQPPPSSSTESSPSASQSPLPWSVWSLRLTAIIIVGAAKLQQPFTGDELLSEWAFVAALGSVFGEPLLGRLLPGRK